MDTMSSHHLSPLGLVERELPPVESEQWTYKQYIYDQPHKWPTTHIQIKINTNTCIKYYKHRFKLHRYTHTYIHTWLHTYIITYIHNYIHTYNRATYIHKWLNTCMHIYIHTDCNDMRLYSWLNGLCPFLSRSLETYSWLKSKTHTYMHTYTHTYTHIHT